MNEPNLIWKHWNAAQGAFDKNLSALRKHIEPDAIHDIRVAVKKLRAYWELFTQLKKQPPQKEQLHATEELFDTIGKQRDVEICLELIADYEKKENARFQELTLYFKQLLRKTRQWSGHAIQAYRKKELPVISSLLKINNNLPANSELITDISLLINHHLSEVKTLFKTPHRVRKSLKKIYYWALALPKDHSTELLDTEKLHDILDDLGKWQDNEILLTRAKHFRKVYLPASFEEGELIRLFEKKVKEKKEEYRKSAFGKTRKLLKERESSGVGRES